MAEERARRAWEALNRRGVAGLPSGRGRGTARPYDAGDEYDSLVMEQDKENSVFSNSPMFKASEIAAQENAYNEASAEAGLEPPAEQRPHTWFEDISRWWDNRNKGGSPFDTAAAAEKLKADEEATVDEATDYELLDVGKVVSGIGNTIKNTQLYTAHVYNMKGEEYLERCHEIQEKLGVNATTLSQDAFDKAWKLTQEVKQKEKLAGVTDANGHVDMDKLYEAMPYLATIHEAHGDAGVLLAMNNAPGLMAINDVYDNEASRLVESIMAGLERGGLQFKRQIIGLQALARGLSSDEGLTAEEVQSILDNAKAMEALPQYSYSSAGGAIGGVLGSAAENLPLMLTSMVAGQAHPAAAIALMAAEVAGGNYIDEISKTDENGKPLYTPRESAIMAAAKGLPEAILEEYKFSQMGKAILGKGAAKKLGELYAKRGAEIAGRESLEAATREIIEERVKSMVRAGILSGKEELTEEFNQAWTTAVVDNMLQSAFRGDKAELKSADDILVESFENAVEAVPAVVGFGLMGAAGNAAVNTKGVLAFRERFKRAQGSRLWREAYENQYREGVIDSVGSALGDIEELNGKHPDMVKQILDTENEKNGVKETDIDLRTLMQTSPETAAQIAQAAGKSQEEIDACLNGTGVITVDTSILQQASYKMTPEQKAAISGNVADVGGMTTNQISDYAKYLGKALETVEVEKVQQEAESVENFVNTTFDKGDRETALDIIAANMENPALEVRNRQRENQALLDEIFKPMISQLKEGAGQGVEVIRETDERGMATGDIVGRVSNNAPWYRNFYADYGRAPTAAEYERIAYENLVGEATRYADELFYINDGSPEVLEELAARKAEIDGLLEERDRLARMADVFGNYKSGEFMAQAAMPEGAREAYQSIYDALKASGVRAVSTNARVNAILAARIAERIAQSYREAGRDVKAKDILPQILRGTMAQDNYALNQQEQARQIDAVRAQYEGTDAWLKAPNGADTKLTEEQWLTVRTPAFKAWFGDWENDPQNASKVVDENGEPLVVYHGTTNTFSEFDKNRIGANYSYLAEDYLGFWFSSDREIAASDYSEGNEPMPVFLNIRNPRQTTEEEISRWTDDMENAMLRDNSNLEEWTQEQEADYYKGKVGEAVADMRNSGQDGIISTGKDSVQTDYGKQAFIAFEPTQIKSATGNNGQFLSDDPNIYHQFAGENAATADTLQLNHAQELEASGAKPEDVYKETGWLKGRDGKWRFVIKDKLDNIDFGVFDEKHYAKLSEVYDNPELYEAYPWLRDITALPISKPKNEHGAYNVTRNLIELNKSLMEEESETIKRTLVHEIQHAIQRREGFAIGGSPETIQSKIEREIDKLQNEWEKLSDEEREYVSLQAIIENAMLGIVEKSEDEIARLRKEKDDVGKTISEEGKRKATRIKGEINHFRRKLDESEKRPFDSYFNLGGEQEARETSRMAGIQQGLDRALAMKEEANAEGDTSKFRKARLEEEYYKRKVNEMPQPHNINAIIVFDGKESAYQPAQNAEAALGGFLQAAWHGSPHKFAKFDLGAIGTGEGAQAHGWGLYFAQDRNVAEGYKDALSAFSSKETTVNVDGKQYRWNKAKEKWEDAEGNTSEAESYALAMLNVWGDGDKAKAIDLIETEIEDIKKFPDIAERHLPIETLEQSVQFLKDSDIGEFEESESKGSLFQVEIPDNDVMLDEQKTFGSQPPKVKEAINKLIADERSRMSFLRRLDVDSLSNNPTGEEIYEALWRGIENYNRTNGKENIDSRRAASELLNEYGIEGITYEGGRDGRCFVVFDDAAINIIDTYNQQANATGERVVRGQYSPMRNIVSLFKEADQSTFMHEMSHFYLNELGKIAEINPDGQAAKDLATVNEWAEWHKGDAESFAGTILADEFAAYEKAILEAEKNGTAKLGGREYTKEELLDVWRQEKFARAFEGYLRDGKAPTGTLKKIFRAFKTWLTKIYGDIIGAGVKPSAEIEAVMARMVATDEEIEAQAIMKDADDVAKVDPDLLNGDTEAMRQRWMKEAKEEAKEKMLKELLKEQAEKDVEAHMEAFEEQERERLAKDPAFAVPEMMEQLGLTEEEAAEVAGYNSVEAWKQDIEAKGGSFDAALSASLEAERDRYTREMPNQEHLSQLAEEALASSEHAQRLTALEAEIMRRKERKYENAPKRLANAIRDLMDALEVMESDDPLQTALLKLKYAHRWEDKQSKQIEAMQATIDSMKEAAQEDKAKLREKLEGQIQKLKDATMQNAEWLRGVRDAANGTYKMTRDAAKGRLLSMSVKDATNTRRWINEARKAAKESATALAKATRKGDAQSYEAAKQAKMRQSFYEAMAAESLNLRREFQRIQNDMKRVQRGLVNAKGEIDASTRYYLGHIQYMLGFRGKDALTPQSLKDFNALFNSFKSNAETGNIGDIDGDVSVPQWLYKLIVSENQPPSKYGDYTIEELQDMRRLVDMLYKVARNKNRLLSESFEGKHVAEVTGELRDEFQKTVTVNKGDEGLSEPFTNILMPAVMLKTLGPSWKKYIYNPLLDGWENQERLFMQAAEDLNKLFKKYWDKSTRRDMRNKELSVTLPDGTHITKENVLAMAMNWGNAGNRLRLCNGIKVDGAPASERDIEDIFRQVLTAKDWEFVQEAWDYINSYGDPVNEVVEKLTGSPMIRIQPQPFTVETSDGQTINLRGGYYPAVYDPKKSTRKEEQDIVTAAQAIGASVFGTGMGPTKARSAEGLNGSPLDLSMDVLFRHVNQEIHIAALRIPCRDVYKLLQNDEIRDMVENSIGRNAYLELKRWCENVWQEPIKKMLWYERLAEAGRRNTVQAIMAFRASVAALNFANPALMARELGIRDTALALLDYLTSGNREWVLEESPFLKNRANNIDRDIRQAQKESFAPESPIKRTITRTSGWMIEQTDMLFSLPTYRWVYKQTFNKAIEQGATEKEAKKEAHYAAEDKVRKIFGSAAVIDQSAVQRTKSPFMKALTPFYTYTSTQANAVFEEYLKARYQGSDVKITDTGEIEAKRKSFMNRWGTMIHAVLYTYLVETLVEQAIRDGIGYLTRGDDDEPWSFEAFKKRWLVQSLTTFTSAIPAVNVAGELLGQQILGERYGARGFGIMSAAQERVLKVEADVAKALQGKGDTIEIGRDVAKAVNTFTGYPDTLTDAVFNLARAYNENFSGREVFWKSIFDKRLKPKKGKKPKKQRKTKKKE